ncbi:lipoprotein insertase outer membrane protein LolB [Alteromonas sp. a30]|uniref:lipoprotein insertase outer membrane protein LolB n=1 Tax=Alteromonas sp. a30 TaxID=2730917 RepID=UPI00227FC780|nr:lipoprotein insertase outer membrane protein LolB [Alteromonas sp. a30]MCY7296992.1 outer membrane lipoprotein LolB [Alteromonas sp. a30]
MKHFSVFLVILTLFSCASAPKKIDKNINLTQHQTQLAQLLNWSIQGRIAIKTPEERFSASLHWQQEDKNYQIHLTNIIGTTLMQLEGNDNYAKLTYDDQAFIDSDPERLLFRITGWRLPVKHLPSLIKGAVPKSGFEHTVSDQGLMQTIKQLADGDIRNRWEANYVNFTQEGALFLPENITLKNASNTIKIRISQWTLN